MYRSMDQLFRLEHKIKSLISFKKEPKIVHTTLLFYIFQGIFVGFSLHAGGSWTGDLFIAVWDDLQKKRRFRSPRPKMRV